MKIAVAGTGYVGLSVATLLAQYNEVTAVDIIPERVEMINSRRSPIQDEYIEKFFAEKQLCLTATLDAEEAYKNAELVVIAAPTNYDDELNHFDTSAVESVINQVISANPDAITVIKSTVPVGFTQNIREKTGCKNILFSPEFLRESKALYDNLYPSRIIVGLDMQDEALLSAAKNFAGLLHRSLVLEYEYPQLSARTFRHAFQLRLLRENRRRSVRDRVPRRLRRNHAGTKFHRFADRQALLPRHRRHAAGEDDADNNDSNCNVPDFHRHLIPPFLS